MANKKLQLPEDVELALMEALLDLPTGTLQETEAQKDARERAQCIQEIEQAKRDALTCQVADALGLHVNPEVNPKLVETLYDALIN